jgi:hypothetical protein
MLFYFVQYSKIFTYSHESPAFFLNCDTCPGEKHYPTRKDRGRRNKVGGRGAARNRIKSESKLVPRTTLSMSANFKARLLPPIS